jgi:Arc/MetJ family transcription regulator
MCTTIEIDEELLSKVMRITGEKRKSQAVDKALRDYLYWEAVKGLRALSGKIDLVDNWYELRHMEPR